MLLNKFLLFPTYTSQLIFILGLKAELAAKTWLVSNWTPTVDEYFVCQLC